MAVACSGDRLRGKSSTNVARMSVCYHSRPHPWMAPAISIQGKTISALIALFQNYPPRAVQHCGPEPNPGHREKDHAESPAYSVEHHFANDQGHEKQQHPTPPRDPSKARGASLFRRLALLRFRSRRPMGYRLLFRFWCLLLNFCHRFTQLHTCWICSGDFSCYILSTAIEVATTSHDLPPVTHHFATAGMSRLAITFTPVPSAFSNTT